jgi:hypothetical protein
MPDGREIYFTVKKVMWHWCVYRNEKTDAAMSSVKFFDEWYFTNYSAKRRADSQVRRYEKLRDKMRFDMNYEKHLSYILDKEKE